MLGQLGMVTKFCTIQAMEKAIWNEANAIREEALEALRKKMQAEHERVIRKISRAHEKTLQVCLNFENNVLLK